MSSLQYRRDTATTHDVLAHLTRCDADFTPPLSARLDLGDYAAKLAERAACFEAWDGDQLVGLVAAYVADCIDRARGSGAATLTLEVATADRAAGRFYEKLGFTDRDPGPADGPTTTLTLDL
jgi:hypothetical protein